MFIENGMKSLGRTVCIYKYFNVFPLRIFDILVLVTLSVYGVCVCVCFGFEFTV